MAWYPSLRDLACHMLGILVWFFPLVPGGHWLQQHCPVLCFLWHPAGCRVRGRPQICGAGRFDCPDLFWTIPTALYVVAILHANNVREGGAWTLSSALKPHKVKTQDFTDFTSVF